MTLQQEIVGNAMQMAVVNLQPGQTVYCEAGKFLFKTSNVSMETRLSGPGGGGGGGQQGQAGGMGGILRQAMGTAMQVGQRALAGNRSPSSTSRPPTAARARSVSPACSRARCAPWS